MTHIHVADDEDGIRVIVMTLLAEEGHEVSGSRSGAEAMRHIVAGPPDLLVLDVMMPELDGFGVLDALVRRGLRKSTRVLMLTARGAEQDREHAHGLGADMFLNKPFDPDELVNAVNELLGLSHEELARRREKERDTAHLLSQLESLFGG